MAADVQTKAQKQFFEPHLASIWNNWLCRVCGNFEVRPKAASNHKGQIQVATVN